MFQGLNIQDQMLKAYIDSIFSKYDKDNSGTLDSQEMTLFFNDLFKSMGLNTTVTEEQSLETIREIDQNFDGAVDKKELFDAFKIMFLNQYPQQVNPNQCFTPPQNNFPHPPNYPPPPNYYPPPPNYYPPQNYYPPPPNYPQQMFQHPPPQQQNYYNPFEQVVHKPNPNHRKSETNKKEEKETKKSHPYDAYVKKTETWNSDKKSSTHSTNSKSSVANEENAQFDWNESE